MKAKKNLGQNFLVDQNIIKRINETVNCTPKDLIIEIGPGMGALTKELKNKNTSIMCFEIDTDMKMYLNALEDNKTKIIYEDIIEANIEDYLKNIIYDKLYVVGNLPYYITTPIIKKLINLNLDIQEIVFMVQLEVADRFTAVPKTKDYSSITLYLQYFYNIEKLFKVSKYCFKPIPKVESAVIKFTKRLDSPSVSKEKYFQLINDSFKMKRKTLKNNLNNYDYQKIKNVLDKYGLSDTVRAEELSEEIFVEIANIL